MFCRQNVCSQQEFMAVVVCNLPTKLLQLETHTGLLEECGADHDTGICLGLPDMFPDMENL